MKRISSSMTFVYKKVLPAIWFGFLVLLFLGLAIDMVTGARWTLTRRVLWPWMVMWMASGVMSVLALDLVDEVVDEGEYLLVRRGTQLERIAIADIAEVYEPMFSGQPRRVTLRLTKTGKLGREITFAAPEDIGSNPLRPSRVARDLVQRVAAARAETAG